VGRGEDGDSGAAVGEADGGVEGVREMGDNTISPSWPSSLSSSSSHRRLAALLVRFAGGGETGGEIGGDVASVDEGVGGFSCVDRGGGSLGGAGGGPD
jgi:hypothetical protein